MDSLYSTVYNNKGECLGKYLNTPGFRTVTSCGINRTLKVRNDTNCHIRILIRNGEFENLQEAKQKISESIYRYDSGCVVKPYSMSLVNTLTFSFYVACFVEFDATSVMLFEKLTNRSFDITIDDAYLLTQLKETSIDDYITYLKRELQTTRNREKKQLSESGKNFINERTKYFKRDYVDFTRSRENFGNSLQLS